MAGTLDGKRALVTGGSRGIGRAIVERLAADGATVAFTYTNKPEAAAEVEAGVRAAGGRAVAIEADVSQAAQIARLFTRLDAVLAEHGAKGLDILVNNAGIAPVMPYAETDEATLDRIYGVNIKGPFLVTQAALTRLVDGGRIVTTGSAVTRTPFPGVLAYSALKGFVDVFTLHLAAELGPRGITVNAVAPGAIRTDMNDWLKTDDGVAAVKGFQVLQRVGEAIDVARVVAFLVGPDAAWVTGQVIDASGGTKL